MTLKDLLDQIDIMGKSQHLINYSLAGTSIAQLNPLEIEWYPVLFSTPAGNHVIKDNVKVFSLTLYYIDRLLEDNSNDIDIFSSSIENLQNLILGIRTIPGVVDVENTYTITNFTSTEKLNDRVAGAYAQVRITVQNDTICFVEGDEICL